VEQYRCFGCMELIGDPVCPCCGCNHEFQNQSHQLVAGSLLRKRYLVGKALDHNGRGITYLGWDCIRNEKVVIKEFYPWLCYQENSKTDTLSVKKEACYQQSMARFLRDMEAFTRLAPISQLVTVYEIFEENQTVYVVQEYISGMTLAEYVSGHGGKLSMNETIPILQPLMKALHRVHKAGLTYRNIHPGSIILDAEGNAKLLEVDVIDPTEYRKENDDFPAGVNTMEFCFMAMEQLTVRGKLGGWTDVYAMCAIIYFCLTGFAPKDVIHRLEEGWNPDWNAIEGLHSKQRKTLEQGMHIRANLRIASMEALLDGLSLG